MSREEQLACIDSPANPLAFAMLGPASQVVVTQRLSGEGWVSWEAKDRRAHDLEVRLGYQSAPAGCVPVSRYRLEIGHGNMAWSQPHTPPERERRWHILPARGAVLRLSARNLRVAVGFYGVVESPDIDEVGVAISINPAIGSHLSQEALSDSTLTIGGVVKFPPEAREWRVSSPITGQPLAAGTILDLLGWGEASIGTVDASNVAEFRAIPIYAAGFRVQGDGGTVVQATFR